jgi:Fe-S oxidoreductase
MKWLGIAQTRALPPFASQTFPAWFAKHHAKPASKKVVLFADTYMTYNYPEIGQAATQLFEAAGYEVLLAVKRCCGRPLLSSGYIDRVKENLAVNVENLYSYVERGYPIVGFEPSCVSMIRDDYLSLTKDPRAKKVADNTYTFEEFVQTFSAKGELNIPFGPMQKKILVHGHCHQKSLWGMGPSLAALNLPHGCSATAIQSGCCGMAGSFGYEAEHYDVSLKVGEERLLKVVRAASPETEIVAAGLSCRQQIMHATGRKARHPAEVLWDVVSGNEGV